MGEIGLRKQQHIELALEEDSQSNGDLFADVKLPYKTLPEIELDEVDTSTQLFGKKLNQPLIIGSMTGGSQHGIAINTNLAIATEVCKVALGVGSQRAALEKPEVRETYTVVRKNAPTAVVFANMGAVQLNYGKTITDYQSVVDMIEADGLYLHINPIQEAIQPEGDTNWKSLISKIEILIKKVKVPVWVKEVGSGIDEKTAIQLINIGVRGIDVAGVGGTSWTWIEGRRANNPNLTKWFKDWGMTTEESVRGCIGKRNQSKFKSKIKIVTSGGIRNPIQGLKAHLLGADYYSAARPFLAPAIKNSDEVIKLISDWEKGLKIAMFGCGIKRW